MTQKNKHSKKMNVTEQQGTSMDPLDDNGETLENPFQDPYAVPWSPPIEDPDGSWPPTNKVDNREPSEKVKEDNSKKVVNPTSVTISNITLTMIKTNKALLNYLLRCELNNDQLVFLTSLITNYIFEVKVMKTFRSGAYYDFKEFLTYRCKEIYPNFDLFVNPVFPDQERLFADLSALLRI